MMNLSIQVSSGSLAFDKKFTRTTMRRVGLELAAVTRSLISDSGGGTGRKYYSPGRMNYRTTTKGFVFKSYIASAPGQPPRRITGTLFRGVASKTFKNGEGVIVRDRVYYGRFLEFGASGAGRRVMLPRPFLTRALAMRRADIEARLKTALDTGITFVRVPP